MGYVVTDGVNRHEFDTLKEALDYRRDVPVPIYRSDNLGNLKRIPMGQLSSAVQVQDYGHETPVPQDMPHGTGSHMNMSIILILGILGFLVAIVLIFFALGWVG